MLGKLYSFNILYICVLVVILGNITSSISPAGIFKNKIKLNSAVKHKPLFKAVGIVMEQKLLAQNSRLLFFVNYENKSLEYRFYANDFIDGVLRDISNYSYRIMYQKQKTFVNLRHNEIILMDNFKSLRYFFEKMYNVGNMDLSQTILYISSLTTVDHNIIYAIFEHLYHMSILRVSLIIELAEDDIVMVTYFPHTEASCRDFKPVIINRFLVDENRWSNLNYFPIKSNNFNGCPVVCCTWEEMPYFKVVQNKVNASAVDYIGLEAELLKFLAMRLNFSIEMYWIDAIKEDINNNRADVFNQIFFNNCDFALGAFTYRKDIDDSSTFSQTDYFFLSPIFIVANVIKTYTTYQKLTLPFNFDVWFVLGLIVAFSSLLICCFGRRQKWLSYRNFLIGSANKTPHFHLYTVALGAGITAAQMPKRNFSRFVLTCWLLGTLILRNAYQSGMYQMLRDNRAWNLPQTIENVFKQNYLISMTPENLPYLSILPDAKHYRILNNTSEAFTELLQAKEPIAFVTPYEYFGYFGKVNGGSWQHLHLVKERLLTQQLTVFVRHNSFLIPEINRQIFKAQFYGFISLWNRLYLSPIQEALESSHTGPLKKEKESNEVYLSMSDLGGIFLILVWLHLLSMGVFLIELLWSRYE